MNPTGVQTAQASQKPECRNSQENTTNNNNFKTAFGTFDWSAAAAAASSAGRDGNHKQWHAGNWMKLCCHDDVTTRRCNRLYTQQAIEINESCRIKYQRRKYDTIRHAILTYARQVKNGKQKN